MVKLYIKTFLCCYLFGSIDTVGMDMNIDILDILELMVGVLIVFFPPVVFISNRFFNKEKNTIYTENGNKEIKKVNDFITYMKSHSPFVKEDNVVLYYKYLLYLYVFDEKRLLLKDETMKPISDIIKKYIYSN